MDPRLTGTEPSGAALVGDGLSDPAGMTHGVGFALSRLEFDVVWEHLGLGPFPTVYRMLGHGQTYDERARLVHGAWDSLGARGIGGPTSLDPELVGLLRILARPEREVDARINAGGTVVRALAGSVGDDGVIGVLDAHGFRFEAVTPGGLSRAVVALPPAHPAGVGHSVSLSDRVFTAACQASGDTASGLRTALAAHGVRPADVDQLADALDGVHAAGQFGAALLDRLGRRRRADRVVGFVDSTTGRYLMGSRGRPERWTTVAPTDQVRLVGEIERLRAELEAGLRVERERAV